MKAKEDQGQRGGRTPFFVCRIARLARSLSLYHLTLPYQHQTTLLIPGLFCAVAPLFILYSLTFVWQASTQKKTTPPSFSHQTTSSLPNVYLFTPAHFSATRPLSTWSIFPSFVSSLSKWQLWTSAPALCLSI